MRRALWRLFCWFIGEHAWYYGTCPETVCWECGRCERVTFDTPSWYCIGTAPRLKGQKYRGPDRRTRGESR